MNRRGAFSVVLVLVLVLAGAGCGGHASPLALPPVATEAEVTSEPARIDLRLSEGTPGPPAIDRARLVAATRLDDAEVAAIWRGAPALAAEPGAAIVLRPGPVPPPRTGATIRAAFPASSTGPRPREVAGELAVVRYAPEGPVLLAPELSVTFSEPMVAVTAHDDAARSVPVKLSPQPPGRWRWVGTRTIAFHPDRRFPQATTYAVEVPAGTRSALGHRLGRAVRFGFETPAPKMVAHLPDGGTQRTDAAMLVVFDQKIDPAAMLPAISVTAHGDTLPVRLLEAGELADAGPVARLLEEVRARGEDGRWVAFRPVQPLPNNAQVEVAIAAGAPSSEGPGTTRAAQSFQFRTYPPLEVGSLSCASNCPVGSSLGIKFNNRLDEAQVTPRLFTITPAIPDLHVLVSGDEIMVAGASAPRTAYRVTVSGGVVDEFGQTLGHDRTLTWTIGDAVPDFYAASGDMVLDPAATLPTYDVFTVNYDRLKVQLYAVAPGDYDAFTAVRDRPALVTRLPGRKVFDGAIATGGRSNQLTETHIDLRPALGVTGRGHAIAVVEPDAPVPPGHEPRRAMAWIQSTRLGIDAHFDADSLVAYATQLDSGDAAEGVAVELQPHGITGTTDEHGMATLSLARVLRGGQAQLIARDGDDVALVHLGLEPAAHPPGHPELAWYVFDDRKLYRPGEQVSLKGWLRAIDRDKHGDVGLARAVTSVTFGVTDARDIQLATGRATVNAAGGFDARFTLPPSADLGTASIKFEAVGRITGSHRHRFSIEEFRRMDFELAVRSSQGPFLIGEPAELTVRAAYLSGGPLGDAPVHWRVHASQTSFTPPGCDDFVFGVSRRYDDGPMARVSPELAGRTDATGAHALHLALAAVHPAVPIEVFANAAVTDVNRQTQAASSQFIVHPSSLYVGVKPERGFVERGAPFDVGVIGVDLDGKPAVGGAIEVRTVRLDRAIERGEPVTREVEPQRCAVTAAARPVRCSFATPTGGEYRLTATVRDARGRPNTTELTYWVSGGDEIPWRRAPRDRVELIAEQTRYSPGSTAQLLVRAPFYPAEGVVTWRRSGIVKAEPIRFDGPTRVIRVPIDDAMVPNLGVRVDLAGMAVRTTERGVPDADLPRRPAQASGEIDLAVLPTERALQVTVTPSARVVAPRGHTQVAVAVRDVHGLPVAGAEVAVVVVDEAVLALADYWLEDPLVTSYPWRSADTGDASSRAYVVYPRPDLWWRIGVASLDGSLSDEELALLAEQSSKAEAITVTGSLIGLRDRRGPPPPPRSVALARAIGGAAPAAGGAAFMIRNNFDALAAFSPALHTGASGTATVDVTVPDNLTRYRVLAVAVAGERQFGKGESAVTARLAMMVRPSAPRFLNLGDRFELPVVVQNQTDAALTVAVAVRASNAAITAGAGREVTVPANDRVELRFPAAAELPGVARFQIAARAPGGPSDGAELAVPVRTPATTEAFATYGAIDDAAPVAQPVALPGRALPGFGGLEVTTASTNLAALTDAVLYLVRYPFECAEQRASRILAIATLADVLAAFGSKDLPPREVLRASVAEDVAQLAQIQGHEGGFAFWDRNAPSLPFLSAHVASALGQARSHGFAVPQAMTDAVLRYLATIEDHYSDDYPPDVRLAVSAYALVARKQLGDVDIAKGKQLLARAGGPDHLPIEADGWLLALFAQDPTAAAERAAIVRHAQSRVSETAGAASFTTSYGDGNHLILASDRRADAVMLDALIQENQDLDLIAKLATGLLAHRTAARWQSTQENAFALAALERYFRTYEQATPDLVARVWLGKDYAGEHAFRGRTVEHHALDIPMTDVASHDRAALTIQKVGSGRLYYRIAMTYAPASLQLAAADRGFVVERRYEAVDDPGDVTRAGDGSWHVKAGARVRVQLSLVNESRRYHVALVDPLPAGLEALNAALATTEALPPAERPGGWSAAWYEHQNLRDERVEAFTQLLEAGVHRYDYVARATTPGSFVVPPPRAEEMYMPETFGRGASDRVVIE